jgi:hypothetical protein
MKEKTQNKSKYSILENFVELGWGVYEKSPWTSIQHLWYYNRRIKLLTSMCGGLKRDTDNPFSFVENDCPHCKLCERLLVRYER